MFASPERRRAAGVLAALVVLACACRWPLLFCGVWRDEGSTFFDAAAPTWAATLHEIRLVEVSPPLYFLFVRAWMHVFGAGDVSLKVPSALFGVALVPMTYAVARSFGTRGAALLAAFFMAASAAAATLSSDARPYTLAALLGAIATWAAFHYLSTPASPRMLPLYALSALLLEYVHYTGGVLLAALAFGALVFVRPGVSRARSVRFFAATGAVALAFVPWLPFVRSLHEVNFLERSGGSGPVGRYIEQLGFTLPVDFMHVQYAWALVVVSLVLFALPYVPKQRDEAEAAAPRLRVAAAVALLAGTWCESVLGLHEQRYMFVFAPLAGALIAVWCVAAIAPLNALARRSPQRYGAPRIALAVAFIASVCAGVPGEARFYARLYGTDRSGMRRLVADAAPSLGPRTLVVVAPDYLGPSLGYYLRTRPDVTLAGVPQWSSPQHSRCCAVAWSNASLVDDTLRRILAATAQRYDAVAYVWDIRAYDEGPVPYSRALVIRQRLMHELRVVSERRYDGTKENVGLLLLRARR